MPKIKYIAHFIIFNSDYDQVNSNREHFVSNKGPNYFHIFTCGLGLFGGASPLVDGGDKADLTIPAKLAICCSIAAMRILK